MKHLSILFAAFIYTTSLFTQCDYVEVNAVSTTGEWGYEMAWELYGPEPNSMNLVASFQGEDDWSNSSSKKRGIYSNRLHKRFEK